MNLLSRTLSLIPLNLLLLLSQKMLAQDLVLRLNLDADTYLESQEIWAHVTITNLENENKKLQLRVLTESLDGVSFKLTNENGKVVEYHFQSNIDYNTENPLIIASQDSLTADFEILYLLADKIVRNAPTLNSMTYLSAGLYSMRAKTRPFPFPQKDTLVSNVVKFRVNKPKGQELNELKLLREADQVYLQELQKNEHTIASAYEKFLAAFPRSRYAPYAYYQLTFLYSYHPLHNDQKVMDLVSNLAKDFPNNSRAVRELSQFAVDLPAKLNKRGVLEKLAREHPDSKVGRFSKKKLLELEK